MSGMYVDPRRSKMNLQGHKSQAPPAPNAPQVTPEQGMSDAQALLSIGVAAAGLLGGGGGAEAAGGAGAGSKITNPNLQPNKPLVPNDVKPLTPEEQGIFGLEISQKDSGGMNIGGPGTVKTGTVKTGTVKQPTQSDTTQPPGFFERLGKDPDFRMKFAEFTSNLANQLDPETGGARASSLTTQGVKGYNELMGMFESPTGKKKKNWYNVD